MFFKYFNKSEMQQTSMHINESWSVNKYSSLQCDKRRYYQAICQKKAKKKYKFKKQNQIKLNQNENQTNTSSIEGQLLLRRFLTLIKKRLRLYLQLFENVSCFLKELYILGSWP